jgi:hypothetical protein
MYRNAQDEMQPSPHDSPIREQLHLLRHRAVTLCALLVLVVVAVALGHWSGASRARLDSEYLQALLRRDRAAEDQIAGLRRQLVDAELGRAVDRQATQSLRETIAGLRDEIAELRDEAALYRNMLDLQGAGANLRVADLELTPGEQPGQFRYYVLLTRSDVRGTLDLQLRGTEPYGTSRQERIVSLRDLAELEEYPIPFRFKYFQAVSGMLTLPQEYEPSKLVIRLAQPGRRDKLRLEFDWQPGPA